MTRFIVSVFSFRNRVSSKEAFEGLELGEGKLSRPVLRGPGGRKAARLLDHVTRGRRRWISSLRVLSGLTELSASCTTLDPDRSKGPRPPRSLFSTVRTAWPATRPAHSFLKFRAYPLNVLPSGFRFLDGDNPADPLIAREWRNILPFCPRHLVRNENLS
jgi:hypothetical protein